MLYSKPELVKLAVEIATQSNLDPALVCSHIDVQSQWNSGMAVPTAIHYLTHQQFPDPMESEYRSIRWGLMGIGGEFARQESVEGPLQNLLDPATNVREGCRILAKLINLDSQDIPRSTIRALLGWNRQNSRESAAQTLLKLEAYRELIARIPDQPRTFLYDGNSHPPFHSQTASNLLVEAAESTHIRMRP